MVDADRPIALFDSGVGGLTVMRAVQELLPQENLIYFGDTARSPYGPRAIEEVRDFALEIMDFMVEQDVKMLVIACNAMTAAAYEEARERYDLPVMAVIEPAARTGALATRNNKIGVIGTKVTIASGSYEKALRTIDENLEIYSQICPAFVEKVEAGDTFSAELVELAEEYLDPLMRTGVDTILLGCTHYPLLRGVLHWVTKGKVVLISSAEEVAKDIYAELVERGMLRQVTEVGSRRYIVSGDADHFRTVGSRFLPGIDHVESRPWPSK